MTIENTLERIAVALERLADAKHTEIFLQPEATEPPPESITESIQKVFKNLPKPTASNPPAEMPKRRGRPPKTQEAAPPPAEDPVAEPAAEGEAPEQEITLDLLRAELVRYANLPGIGSDTARKLMHVHSGAETLKAVPKDRIAVVYRAVQDAIAKEA